MNLCADENHQDAQLALILCTDITKLRKHAKIQEAHKLQTVYFASLAHDLKTPINSVIGINNTLRFTLPESSHEPLLISDSSCKHLLSLIDDITDLSKM